jgi:hypothetical protein
MLLSSPSSCHGTIPRFRPFAQGEKLSAITFDLPAEKVDKGKNLLVRHDGGMMMTREVADQLKSGSVTKQYQRIAIL